MLHVFSESRFLENRDLIHYSKRMLGKNIIDLKFGLYCDVLTVRSYDSLHRHDEIEILFFPNKSPATVRFGAQIIQVEPEQTILFWGSIPHQLMHIEDDSIQYWVAIPPEAFLYFDLSPSLVRDVMDGKVLVEADPEMRAMDLACYPIWKREAASQDEDLRRTLLLSLEARLRRFRPAGLSADSLHPAPWKQPGSRQKNAFQSMYDYITLNYREPIRVEDIAEAASLHPNYAISMFKEKCGINIVALVTMLRVYEAQRLLLTTDRKIVDIAMETGFGSLSNFYKSFVKITKRRPSDYRAVVHPPRGTVVLR
jgi:AraC-like DNA-binding protein